MTEATAPKKQLALSDEETFVDPPGADGSAAAGESSGSGTGSDEVDATVVDAKMVDAKTEDSEADAAKPVVDPEPAASTAPEKKPIQLRVFGRTDVGQVREHNEDNFLVADLSKGSRGLMEGDRRQEVGPRGTVLGVCDGMGGAAAGEVASQLAVDIVYQRMLAGEPPSNRDEIAARLVHAIESAGMRIFAEAKANRAQRGMGTTATVAALMDSRLYFGQVGDSRAYLLRGDRLVQVTRDQSLVNQLIEAGQLTEEEAETFEHNNIILQALGTAESVQVDLTHVDLFRGDLLLLCSDGLSGMVRNDEIREVLMAFPEPLEACRELTDRANLAGGHDNVTVVVARFEGEGLPEPTPADVEDLKYRKSESIESSKPTDSSGQRSSLRPGRLSLTPNIETSEEDLEDYPELRQLRHDDPVELPHDGAPSWIVTMLIVSAVTCIVVLGYYFLRP
jgi:protein phosphatase